MTRSSIITLGIVLAVATVHGQFLYTVMSLNEEAQGYFGHTVSTAGDFNLDGYDDVLVSAY
jgi:hypothetical protein